MNATATIPTRYLCWGRMCQCGQRVTTWRVREDEQLEPGTLPSNYRFYCGNGNVHFLSVQQVMCAPLQWVEEEFES